MAIEALYPSRRQSRRNNPLFARERRMRRLGYCVLVAAALAGTVGLRSAPAVAAAETGVAPVHHVTFRESAQAPVETTVMKPVRPIRVIPLFKVPSDAITIGQAN